MYDKKALRRMNEAGLKELAVELSEEKDKLCRLRDEAKQRLVEKGRLMDQAEWDDLNKQIKYLAETLSLITRRLETRRKRMFAREKNYYQHDI